MGFSIGLALQYAVNLPGSPVQERKPFYLSVPDKEHFTLPFACGLLLNYLYEDYFNPPALSFNAGDKVELFGSIAQYIGLSKSVTGAPLIRLLLRDNETTISAQNAPFLNRFSGKRRLSKSIVKQQVYQAENDLNSLFNLSGKEIVNPKALSSQLYLIAGRGNTVSLREKLGKEVCISQKMAEAFCLDTNLIVKPTLENLNALLAEPEYSDTSYFTDFLRNDLAELREIYGSNTNLAETIERLNALLTEQNFNPAFRSLFNRLATAVDEPYKSNLLNLTDQIPDENTEIPERLKLVVLNTTDQVRDYSNTISRLLDRGIPVIVLTDRSELSSAPDYLPDSLANGYRFCWSRNMISSLADTKQNDYCDSRFWQRCTRYANQEIIIRRFADPAGDSLFSSFEASHEFVRLEGFHTLKKSYYKHLRPALYLLKNTLGNLVDVIDLIRKQTELFTESFNPVENLLPADLANTFRENLLLIRSYTDNPKQVPAGTPVFVQRVDFPDGVRGRTSSVILRNFRVNDLTVFNGDSLVFTGFPYRETNGRYLADATFHYLIPSVTVLAWPAEANRLTGYLARKLRDAVFDGSLPEWISRGVNNWRLPLHPDRPDDKSMLIRQGNDDDQDFYPADKPEPAKLPFAEIQQQISNFRFSDLFDPSSESAEYLVPVNIIHFHSGSYMFLPYGRSGQVYVLRKQEAATGEIVQASFDELSAGQLVICFNMNREIIRDLSKSQLTDEYARLDIWRERLQLLTGHGSERYTRSVNQLLEMKATLGLTAGNPAKQNIIRWLHDTDMLAPHKANLWIILRTSGMQDREATAAVSQIESAKRLIVRTSSQVADRIKSKIIGVLREKDVHTEDMTLDVDGVPVTVHYGRISSLERRSDMKVPYMLTNRFIKD
jgi:hypothetical protein